MKHYWGKQIYLGDRWAGNVRITVSPQGIIEEVIEGLPREGTLLDGPVLPPMPNLHSHAFQRAMAGLAERASLKDNFWTWREEMYRLAEHITPDLYRSIAQYLFVEMLESGYGAVAEFHYLHGRYPEAMMEAIQEAANEAGIHLTLIPVFYAHSNFGGKPPSPRQGQFCLTLDHYARLFESIEGAKGLSFHSLRAATMEEIKCLLPLAGRETPIHTHIAEQEKEVEDCLEAHGQSPIDYLLDHVAIDRRWTFIHATHISEKEMVRIVSENAVVGLCPTTESNLGDGFFNAMKYRELGGRWGIGTDSHITIDPAQELRTLEYHQRLKYQSRNMLHNQDHNVAHYLYGKALAGGAQALGQKIGKIEKGYAADFLVLDAHDPMIGSSSLDHILARAVFACKTMPVREVYIGGNKIVVDGIHRNRQKVREDFIRAVAALR